MGIRLECVKVSGYCIKEHIQRLECSIEVVSELLNAALDGLMAETITVINIGLRCAPSRCW